MAKIINHKPLSGRKNIERQTKEQSTINQIIKGVTITLIIGILFVAALASVGGYALYKQIQDQSLTIAQLENNTQRRMAAMEEEILRTLQAKDRELELAFANSNRRITELNTNFETYQSDTKATIARLTSANRKLEQRLSAYQRRLDEQNDLITYYQKNSRSRFLR